SLSNHMFCPLLVISGVFLPHQVTVEPASSHKINPSIPVDIHGDGGEVVKVLILPFDLTNERALFITGSFVPKTPGHDIQDAISVDIKDTGRLGTFSGN